MTDAPSRPGQQSLDLVNKTDLESGFQSIFPSDPLSRLLVPGGLRAALSAVRAYAAGAEGLTAEQCLAVCLFVQHNQNALKSGGDRAQVAHELVGLCVATALQIQGEMILKLRGQAGREPFGHR